MTDSGNRYGNAPLGKSVEEIEQESGNLENSPVQGEQVRDQEGVAVPAIVNGNASSIPAIVNVDRLTEGGSGADDGTAPTNRDSSEGTV
ncbi:hypothetical protein DEIPH_ctg025orf0279 [Deinococcus phoenicis]|uniref:Uncharacterized protein n=1 Tax=Deinococcus phoenicis TaxID=1476583 RepID=A0A016QRH9_9DEIO|nr:hypothetical protein [Deinococcus phoenicis]EYB68389.1 hypothetical protein DEIPH_ctg025orf0279 [Deinococcus phoenicis]